jgi:cholesterol transport system auxiliary component
MCKTTLNLLLMPMLVGLSACSLLGPVKTPTINTYTLTPHSGVIKEKAGQGILLITMPTATPGLDTSDMIYIQKPHQLNHFAHNQWVASPAKMLMPLLVQSAEKSSCFTAVVSPPFSNTSDFNLQTNVTAFQQEFMLKNSRVRLGLNVTLIDNASGKIRQKWIEVSVPVSENTPYAGVKAMNEATTLGLKQVNRFVCTSRR